MTGLGTQLVDVGSHNKPAYLQHDPKVQGPEHVSVPLRE